MDDQTTQRKLALLSEPHMQPLVDYRKELLQTTGKQETEIPHFDPEDAGSKAELLLLLTHVDGDPGLQKRGSLFISKENEDQTAKNFSKVLEALGLRRSAYVIWNVVPWLGGHPEKDAAQGASYLPGLIKALPELRGVAVMSMKNPVRKAVEKEIGRPGLALQMMLNPGPQSYFNNPGELEQQLRSLADRLSLLR